MAVVTGVNVQVPALVAEHLVDAGHAVSEPTVEFTNWDFSDPKVADPRLIVDSPSDVLITLITGGMHIRALALALVDWIHQSSPGEPTYELRATDARGYDSEFELGTTTQAHALDRFLRGYL